MNKYSNQEYSVTIIYSPLNKKIAPSQQCDSNHAIEQKSGNKFDNDLHFLGLQSG